MSTVYTLEPPTKGKVVLKTTMGPVDIELWPKEAPKAVRNFVQLCLEGYYDRTIFHRIIKSFLVQGGDPTGSGTGGESIYGGAFADEFHTRLRFNHRGVVACANAGSPHSNGSQFFISLDRCDWLDRKNTIFGKVTGDSIYNLLRLGEVEADGDDRPLDPPMILSVEVLWNPFDDIIPRKVSEKPLSHIKTDDGGKASRKKAEKKLNVLSFGEEVEDEENELEAAGKEKIKIKSIHDVLDDPRFLKEEVDRDEPNPAEVERKKDIQLSVREALNSRKGSSNKDEGINARETYDYSGGDDDDDDDGDDEAKFDAHMRLQILRKRRELGDISTHEKSATDKSRQKERQNSSPRRDPEDDEPRKSKMEKLYMKKKGIGSEARSERLVKADADLQLLNHAEQGRQMQKQKKRRLHGREEDTLAKLGTFRKTFVTKLSVPGSSNNSMETADGDTEPGWMTNQLKFIPDSTGKDGMARKDDPNVYVVHDPLLEKGKEKFNRMQAKVKRREREWAGKSLT